MRRPVEKLPTNYKTLRGLQISTVFFFTIIIQELLHYPRAGWTGFAVMMIYAGFDNGTTILRAYHRFLGMLIGLVTGYLLWFLGHVDYRLLIFIIPATIFFAYFFSGLAYSVPTIFTVNTAVIGTGYFYSQSSFVVTNFIIDYFMCTVVAFIIILGFEYFLFKPQRMMRVFIGDKQAKVIMRLYQLLRLLNQEKIRRTDWFNACIALNEGMFEVNMLVSNAQFYARSEQAVGNEFNQFIELTNQIYIGLKALYMAYHSEHYHKLDYNHLLQQVKKDLVQLKTYIQWDKIIADDQGVMHESPS